nr:hypothetical protein 25 [bacterium]
MSKKNLIVEGTDDIARILEDIAPNHARTISRQTVHHIAGIIRNKAKKYAPRELGNLRRAIYTKRRKSAPDAPVSEVRVKQGKGGTVDAFYWRFVEYGTGGGRGSHLPLLSGESEKLYPGAKPFFKPAEEETRRDLPKIFNESFVLKLEKKVISELKKRRNK